MAVILSRNQARTVPLLSTYGTASLLSMDGQVAKVPLALLLGGSNLVRSIVAESHLHPGVHGPLILSFTVAVNVLASVGDMLALGQANVREENIDEVTQVLDLLGVNASLSRSRINIKYEDIATKEEAIKLEIVFEPFCGKETELSDCNVIETKNKLWHMEANLNQSGYEQAPTNEDDDDGILEKEFESTSKENSDLSEVDVDQAKNNSPQECHLNTDKKGERPTDSYHTNKKEATKNTMKKCNICEYTTKSAFNLTTHMRTHTGEKPYTCEICNTSFSQSGSFRNHCRIHNGDKPFKCKVCTFSCSHPSSLIRHNRIHSDEKPYKCKMCTYCSSDSSDLKKHNRIHTGEKPYTCKICNRSFSRSYNLRMHGKIHTEQKDRCVEISTFNVKHPQSLQKILFC